jgi:hypothetical protein
LPASPTLAVDPSLGVTAAASPAWNNANASRVTTPRRETIRDARTARPERPSSAPPSRTNAGRSLASDSRELREALQAGQDRVDERQAQQTLPLVTLRSV